MSDSSISLTPGGSDTTGNRSVNGSSDSTRAGSSQSSGQAAGEENGEKAVPREEISKEKLQESTRLLNKTAEILQREIRFNVLPEQDVIQAEIVNRDTDKVIKQIPPDEIIEMRKKIDAFIGLFVDEER